RYWILVEMLREQSDYTLKMQGKYTFKALAMQMHCNSNESEDFVHDCTNEFGLFNADGEEFWSESLVRRMARTEQISQRRKKTAERRRVKAKNKEKKPSNVQVHSKSNANGMQGKESAGKKSKRKYLDNVLLKNDEYKRLINEFGQEVIDSK